MPGMRFMRSMEAARYSKQLPPQQEELQGVCTNFAMISTSIP